MRVDIHHHIEIGREVLAWLDVISKKQDLIINQMERLMAAIDDLAAAVAAEDTTIDSAVVLLNGIPALISAAGVDPTKLAALQADITAKTATLAAAVVVGTPVAPAGAPVVTPAAATTAATAAVAASPPAP
jgi:cell division septum initiation protein DivIVA